MLLSSCGLSFTCRALQDWAGGVGQSAFVSRWRGRGSLLQGGASSSPADLRGEGEGCGRGRGMA